MIKAIIFDFDGVIIETERERFKDYQKILKSYGYILENSYFKQVIGKKSSYFIKEKFKEIPLKIVSEILEKRRKMLNANMKRYKLIPGIKKLLNFLKEKGYSLAITTGSQSAFVKKVLRHNSLEGFFKIIVSGEQFTSSKPNPECYVIALKKLGILPKEAIVIEDAVAGIMAGKKAGCRVIGIKTYFNKKDLAQADKVCKEHKDILEYIRNMPSVSRLMEKAKSPL